MSCTIASHPSTAGWFVLSLEALHTCLGPVIKCPEPGTVPWHDRGGSCFFPQLCPQIHILDSSALCVFRKCFYILAYQGFYLLAFFKWLNITWISFTVGGNAHRCSLCGKQYGDTSKNQNGTVLWPSGPTSGDLSEET